MNVSLTATDVFSWPPCCENISSSLLERTTAFQKVFCDTGITLVSSILAMARGRVIILCSILKFYLTNKIAEHVVHLRSASSRQIVFEFNIEARMLSNVSVWGEMYHGLKFFLSSLWVK